MNDRLRKLGLLTQLRQDLVRMEHRAQGIVGSISDATFVVRSVWDLDGQRVANYGRELAEVLEEGRKLRGRIEQLEDETGA
jgi:hypothetical protein